MKKSETLRSTKDPKIAVPIINELKATIEQVEPGLRKSAEVIIIIIKIFPVLTLLLGLEYSTPQHVVTRYIALFTKAL